MKVTVAGAGIAGSVLTRMLRERGHEVTLLDPWPERAASRCAYAYLRLGWFKGPDKVRVRQGLDWYERNDWIVTRKADVHDRMRGRYVVQTDHVLIHPSKPLLAPDIRWGLDSYAEDALTGVQLRVFGQPGVLYADHLVLACGPGMRRWSMGTPVYGGVFECESYRMGVPLRLLRLTDRLTHVAADDGTVVRTAASKGRTPEEARERSEKILARMFDEGMLSSTHRWTYRAGTRWTGPDGDPVASQLSEHVWALTGFARTGYALAPSYARDLVDKLEAS